MLTAIVLSTLAILFALWAFHVASKGAHPLARVMGYFAGFIGLLSIWQYELIEQEPNMSLVVLFGVGALIIGLGLLFVIFRPGWNRTR